MPLNIDWKQILLHAFNLVLLFCILFFLLYKPVKKFMTKRADEYKRVEEETKQKLAEANTMKTEYEEKLAGAENEIASKKAQAEQETRIQRENVLKDAQQEAEQLKEKVLSDAEKERKKIVAGAQDDIASIVGSVCEKFLADVDVSASFDSFLQEVNEDEK